MKKGSISELVSGKDYGRIRTADGLDVHFHKHCLWDTRFTDLKVGQKVEFEVQPAYRGHLAFHIRPCPKRRAGKRQRAKVKSRAR